MKAAGGRVKKDAEATKVPWTLMHLEKATLGVGVKSEWVNHLVVAGPYRDTPGTFWCRSYGWCRGDDVGLWVYRDGLGTKLLGAQVR